MKFDDFGQSSGSTSRYSKNHRWFRLACIVLCCIFLAVNFGRMFDYNPSGKIMIKQSWGFPWMGGGKLSLKTTNGIVLQMFGYLWDFDKETSVTFSNSDNGKHDAEAIFVRFNDGGTAYWGGEGRFKYPADTKIYRVLKIFGSQENTKSELFVPGVREICTSTASLMSTEESYTTKRPMINDMCFDQAQKGVYFVDITYEKFVDEFGKESTIPVYNFSKERRRTPIFGQFNIDIRQFKIVEFDFLGNIDEQINKKMKYRADLQVVNEDIKKYEQLLNEVEATGQRKVTQRRKQEEKVKEEWVQKYESYREQQLNLIRSDSIKTENELAATIDNVAAEINEVKGAAALRRKARLGDNSLSLRLKSYNKIMAAWYKAIAKRSEIAPEQASDWDPDYFVNLLQRIDKQVRKDLGLDLTF